MIGRAHSRMPARLRAGMRTFGNVGVVGPALCLADDLVAEVDEALTHGSPRTASPTRNGFGAYPELHGQDAAVPGAHGLQQPVEHLALSGRPSNCSRGSSVATRPVTLLRRWGAD